MRIAVLVSEQSWFVPYARELVNILISRGYDGQLFFKHEIINEDFEIVFILSYFRIIEEKFLKKHKHNLVVHESAVPKGRGWSPLFWQILEGENRIPVVLFEATEKADEGDIYLKDYILFEGDELHNEIRDKQANKTLELCLKFLDDKAILETSKQQGENTYYRKRRPKDSELDINKSIKEQFNLLRIVNNKDFPAFFYYNGHKYILNIYKDISEKRD